MPDAPTVQLFGRLDSQPTRAAQRFFKERRVTVHLVDLGQRPMAAGELRRFVDRLGPEALVDTNGRAYKDAGLGYLKLDRGELAEKLLVNQKLLKLPLVRFGNEFTVGLAEFGLEGLARQTLSGDGRPRPLTDVAPVAPWSITQARRYAGSGGPRKLPSLPRSSSARRDGWAAATGANAATERPAR